VKRVLIAEDEPSIVLSLEFLLRSAGHEVLTAGNGANALAIAEERRPHLIVLDVMLPVVDGFEVCRQLRANDALKTMRILMLTARGREHEIARGLAIGADAYVTKPFATRSLMETVAKLLADAPARPAPYSGE
jgi:two-component system, OmpR family, alkaline phosphatase synthesis response regulator PhoP